MVRVHRLQALQASHDVSTVSQVLNFIHWKQALLAASIAVVISWMSLMSGFHHKGRPFGSREAAMRTITLIAATTLIASALSVLVPRLPFSMGIFIPGVLSAAVLKENETVQELRVANPYLAAFVTLSISFFYGLVKDQIFLDRGNWCDRQIERLQNRDQNGTENEFATLSSFAAAGDTLRYTLAGRLPDDQKDKTLVEVSDHYSVIGPAARQARDAFREHKYDLFGERYNEAKEAVRFLLQIAYNWKYDVDLTAALNPSARFTEPPDPPARSKEPSRGRGPGRPGPTG
jgi:hypothetical protein